VDRKVTTIFVAEHDRQWVMSRRGGAKRYNETPTMVGRMACNACNKMHEADEKPQAETNKKLPLFQIVAKYQIFGI
jgi:hypothetical protein